MRILITNDDGITAPGLEVAEEIAAALAGPDGEIWVVAPASSSPASRTRSPTSARCGSSSSGRAASRWRARRPTACSPD